MTFWELRTFVIACDHPGCSVEARVECPHHVLGSLPAGWVSIHRGNRTELRCPEHAEEVSE